MRPIFQSMARIVFMLPLALLLCPVLVAAQTYPRDDARLYELAKKEGTVVWYVSAPLEPSNAIAEVFQKKYPGVRVEILRIVGPAQYQRFMQEVQAKQNLVDILHISDLPSINTLIDDGHVADWRVATHDRFPAAFRVKNHAYANYPTSIAIVYNTNKLTAEEVKMLESGWKAVIDPRFRGRFAVTTMKCGGCYAGIHMFLDPKFKDEFGPNFIRQIAAQKPAIYSDILVGLDRVIAGEHDFTYWSWEAIANTKWMQGAPIRWIQPSPTPEFGVSWQAISRYSPHPNAARLFQNWSMSEDGAVALQEKYGSSTTLTGVADKRKVTREAWYRPIRQRYNVDYKRWDADYDKDMALWSKSLQDAR